MVSSPEPRSQRRITLTPVASIESDSDSEIESYTNRGNKLKKRARFAHKGQLLPTTSPVAYKEVRVELPTPVTRRDS
jgi:hypothetical protein